MTAVRDVLTAERHLIGCALADNTVRAEVGVDAGEFHSAECATVWRAIDRLVEGGAVADAVTVGDFLDSEKGTGPVAQRFSWLAFVGEMANEMPTAANANHFARAVKASARVRRAAAIGRRLAEQAADEGAIGDAIRDLMALDQGAIDFESSSVETMRAALELIEAATEGRRGVPTGLRDLDAQIGGFGYTDLIVIGARPGMGKTAMLLNMAESNARIPIGIISGEQPRGQIGIRQMALAGRLSAHRMRMGELSELEWDALTAVGARLKDRPVWVNDQSGPTVSDVIAQARIWRRRHRIEVLFVDYLQRLAGGEGETFRLQIGDAVRRLKNLARELEIPVVVLAQVKRDVEKRELGQTGLGRMPQASDLAEASIIENEADLILTLTRPWVYQEREDFRGRAWVHVAKNRHGPTCTVPVAWQAESMRFADLGFDSEVPPDRTAAHER